MHQELRIVTMNKETYYNILDNTKDPNVDISWNIPHGTIEEIMKTTNGIRHFALIEDRLYELPEDWREIA